MLPTVRKTYWNLGNTSSVSIGTMLQNMCETGRLDRQGRKSRKLKSLLNFFVPANFPLLIEAVKIVTGLNEKTNTYKTPSLALKLSNNQQTCWWDSWSCLSKKHSYGLWCDVHVVYVVNYLDVLANRENMLLHIIVHLIASSKTSAMQAIYSLSTPGLMRKSYRVGLKQALLNTSFINCFTNTNIMANSCIFPFECS